MQRTPIVGSIRQAIGHALVAGAIGLIALPLVFSAGSDVSSAQAWLWLTTSALVSAWLFLPGPVLARALAQILSRLPGQNPHRVVARNPTLLVSQRMLAVAYVVVVQAIVRRPFVAAFGATAEPLVVEAIVAVVALLVLLVVLGLLHQVGRPLVQGLATVGLDTIVATSGSDGPVPAPRRGPFASQTAPATATVRAPAETMAQETVAAGTQSAMTRPRGQRGSVA